MAACETAEAHTAEIQNQQQEGPTGPANAAEAEPLSDLFPGRQSSGISSGVASVSQMKNGERRMQDRSSFYILNSAFRKATDETSYPLPKPIALPQELQTKSCHSNPTGAIKSRVQNKECRM